MKTKQKMLTKPITAGFASIFFILKVSKMGFYRICQHMAILFRKGKNGG